MQFSDAPLDSSDGHALHQLEILSDPLAMKQFRIVMPSSSQSVDGKTVQRGRDASDPEDGQC